MLIWGVLIALAVIGLPLYLAIFFGSKLDGVNDELALNPAVMFMGVLRGTYVWPASGTWILIVALLAVVAIAAALLVRRGRRRAGRSRVDDAAAHMGRGRDIASLTRKHASATAARLGVEGTPGIPIGKALSSGEMLYGSFEDMHIDVWGPRTGKTTSRAVPAILEAPGAVLVTSNKRDVVDATRLPRQQVGAVWVFDPQGIALEQPTWWYNPLSYVTDETKAAKLADHFASGSRAGDARTDAYFEPAGQDLLTAMLLAAAVGDRPITDVYLWLSDQQNETPADLLKDNGEYPLIAEGLLGVMALHPEQRGGIYGTALQMASSLKNRQIAQWVTPLGGITGDRRPQFDPHEFVKSTQTLYSLSKEGKGTAGPLVLALTAAVVEAAEDYAATQPGGRLKTPMTGVLDEAANVCRWSTLPDLYSHYGSRGIVLMTILQSWSQGCEVWGQAGMKKLWSASNIKVYGGGVDETEFLESMSKVIGDYHYRQFSASTSRSGGSLSESSAKDRILDVSDLASMPRGRAVVFASGARPTLIRTVPYWNTRHKAAVEASKAAADPANHVHVTLPAETAAQNPWVTSSEEK
ncbi:TraM recognition domain-containing protein [Streptomyces sp. ISL-90]|nr:TraM recognition domain-containing protein [Streptomyces sp. ISL-90]